MHDRVKPGTAPTRPSPPPQRPVPAGPLPSSAQDRKPGPSGTTPPPGLGPAQPDRSAAARPALRLRALAAVILLIWPSQASQAAAPEAAWPSPYQRWTRGPSKEPSFFPLAVWLQSPARAEQYRRAGFNTYVGLWKGPTDEQLSALRQAGLKVVCQQNATGLRHLDDPTIIAWMHGDEPDNAQPLGAGKGYGPPMAPEKIIADYQRMRAADPSRPVLLNLGQGVAWDRWHGRGVRTHHPEDYPEYVKGCDIASFDIYPVVHTHPEVAGNLWFVARGVERLLNWAGPDRVVWNCLECTRISNPDKKPTPQQVRAEAWMSLIHGSRGLIYFVHQFKPVFREAALLDDADMLAAVTALNRQITELAPVLNSPTVREGLAVKSDNPDVPLATLMKRHGSATYLFAVGMRDGSATATFTLRGLAGRQTVEVLGESRSLTAQDGAFSDRFGPWEVHLYRLRAIPP